MGKLVCQIILHSDWSSISAWRTSPRWLDSCSNSAQLQSIYRLLFAGGLIPVLAKLGEKESVGINWVETEEWYFS